MTVLEFICAQAPLRMKGSLIGIWYASFVLRYFVVNVLDTFILEDIPWFIFHGVRGFFILVYLLLYCYVAKHYCYCQRDKVVNERFLVEEVYDRELQLAEEYEREKREEIRALYGHIQARPSYCTIAGNESTNSVVSDQTLT